MASEGTAGGELALVELADLSDTGRVRRPQRGPLARDAAA